MVDASKYAPKRITPDAVRDSAITTTIIEVLEDERFDRLILETGIGAQFGLNAGNTNTLHQGLWPRHRWVARPGNYA